MASADRAAKVSLLRRAIAFAGLDHAEATARLQRAAASASRIPDDPTSERARLQFLLVFATIYGLSDADTMTIGSAATELRHALVLSNFELGTLLAVTTGVGALTTLPAGVLADRVRRIPLLAWSVALWALAMGASALASSYAMLLATRVLLGGLLALNGPVTASLLGDLWPAVERGRIYGLITSGELLGAGTGFLASGELAALSWRLAFGALAVPAVVLAWAVRRLPEPQRTLVRMERGPALVERPGLAPSAQARGADPSGTWPAPGEPAGRVRASAALLDGSQGAGPGGTGRPGATGLRGFWRVVAYVLAIRTNVVLVLAGGFTWFFLSAVELFGEEFAKEQYGLSQEFATVFLVVVGAGAMVGATVSGHVGDTLVRRGHRSGRMSVAAGATVLATVAFVPALVTRDALVAMPMLIIAAFGLAAANPPIDATRIEVVPSWIWGRAEAVRSVLRMGFQAAAPLVVGALADSLGGGGRYGLELAFLSMLALVLLAGLFLAVGHLTYPADRVVAVEAERQAAASRQRVPHDDPSRAGEPAPGRNAEAPPSAG
ncbi:MAG: MFS transporter [Actinomycetota bacterium]|jgi:predicted MFS family arabinose efflux permease|nr:MFS transporter [Actinomycetota bacterium]